MVAVLKWQNSTTTNANWGAASGISVMRFKAANDNVDDLTNPLVRPTSGTNYSWEKALRILIFNTSTFTELSNLRVKSSTSDIGAGLGSGVTCYYLFKASYTQPVLASTTPATTLTTSEVTWTGAGNHNAVTHGTNDVQWGGNTPPNSNFLYLWLGITPGNGGSLTNWNTIAVYNEI